MLWKGCASTPGLGDGHWWDKGKDWMDDREMMHGRQGIEWYWLLVWPIIHFFIISSRRSMAGYILENLTQPWYQQLVMLKLSGCYFILVLYKMRMVLLQFCRCPKQSVLCFFFFLINKEGDGYTFEFWAFQSTGEPYAKPRNHTCVLWTLVGDEGDWRSLI